MPINNIAFQTEMTAELDKKLVQGAQTGIFADNNLRAKFVGAKTVTIPVMGMSGLGDYDRDTGFARGGVSVSHKPFTLTQDRGVSFQIDREDADESGIPDLAGPVMGEFVRTKVVPEVDAYVLSKLAGYAYSENQVLCFVDSTALSAAQNSPEISRRLVLNDFKKGEINTTVTTLNGVPILPVQDSHMKTAYTFHDGSADEFGFEPTETAKNIGLLLVPRRAASLVKKTDQVRTFAPGENLNADAYKLDYRLYYDVVVKDSMVEGIYVHTY